MNNINGYVRSFRGRPIKEGLSFCYKSMMPSASGILTLPFHPLPVSLLAYREGKEGWVILYYPLQYSAFFQIGLQPLSQVLESTYEFSHNCRKYA
jgi:hypothetical protein